MADHSPPVLGALKSRLAMLNARNIPHVRSRPESGQSGIGLAGRRSADSVAKVGGPFQACNFRIQPELRLNQSCASALFLESILRIGMLKIVLQHYLP
jgi:hypothetical protein